MSGSEAILRSLSELKDFEYRDSLCVYSPENLHYYIDGGAEFYLKNGFVKLATTTVASKKSGEEITVEIYELENAARAGFIYEVERGDFPDNFQGGDKGYRSGDYVEFVKGEFLVKLVAFQVPEGSSADLATISRFIEKKIPL